MQYTEEKTQAQVSVDSSNFYDKAKSFTILNTIYFPLAAVNLLLPFSSI